MKQGKHPKSSGRQQMAGNIADAPAQGAGPQDEAAPDGTVDQSAGEEADQFITNYFNAHGAGYQSQVLGGAADFFGKAAKEKGKQAAAEEAARKDQSARADAAANMVRADE